MGCLASSRESRPPPQPLRDFIQVPENRLAFLAVQRVLDEQQACLPRQGGPSLALRPLESEAQAKEGASVPSVALQASMAGKKYALAKSSLNPLLIYGPPGSGKSMLVFGLIQAFLGVGRQGSVRLIEAADWPDSRSEPGDVISAWSNELKECPLLIVEDLHHLIGDDRVETILTHLIDDALAFGRQLIFTSFKNPHRFQVSSNRLVGRLTQGLAVGIQPLSNRSRLLILQELARRDGLIFAAPALAWLANQLPTSVRELRAILTRLNSMPSSPGCAVTLEQITAATTKGPRLGDAACLTRINARVARHFHLSPQSLRGPRCTRQLQLPRQVGMFLARQVTRLPTRKIGEFFGGRDHSTVLYACQNVTRKMKTNSDLELTIYDLQTELEGLSVSCRR